MVHSNHHTLESIQVTETNINGGSTTHSQDISCKTISLSLSGEVFNTKQDKNNTCQITSMVNTSKQTVTSNLINKL
ncbi:unnamed protein product [Heterobilharzia americana]|nr:unnamed protein product [Heterobilharzia americana]